MQTLISVVRANLIHHGMKPEPRPSGCHATLYGQSAQWTLEVITNENDRWMVCRSLLPGGIPLKFRRQAAQLITGCDYRLISGGFELGLRNGEVAFKTGLRLSDDELTDAMVDDMLGVNFSMFEHYFPGFMALIHGRRTVDSCLKLVEKPLFDPADPQDLFPTVEYTEDAEDD